MDTRDLFPVELHIWVSVADGKPVDVCTVEADWPYPATTRQYVASLARAIHDVADAISDSEEEQDE